ncbi:MAG TPA: M13 family metallopeptidase [Arachidicoccus sp.]|nr:M13 family metallopeptidase [Arachidicoccus sp.]
MGRYNYSEKWLIALTGILLFYSCKNSDKTKGDILAVHIDTSVRPQDDFFAYANGKWLKQNPIPAAYKSWGIGYEVQEDLFDRLKKINEASTKHPDNPISKKIAAFYSSGMDSAALSGQSIAVLTPQWSMVDSIETAADVWRASAALKSIGVDALCSIYIGQDDKNSGQIVVNAMQGGLGLPNRDYYIKTDKRTTDIRNAYIQHIAGMLQLAGTEKTTAQAISNQVFEVEKKLAIASRPLADLRDPYKNYHKIAVHASDMNFKTVKWANWLPAAGIPAVDSMVIGQPEFFTALDRALSMTPVPVWKAYMRWQLLRSLGKYVNNDFETADFNFYGKVMGGLKAQKPRWKRVLEEEEDAMGEALGQLFVRAYFPEKAKKRYTDLVENIRTALKNRINQLSWMSAATKLKALDKLSKMHKKVGYPDKWKDFSDMAIIQQPYVKNVMAARKWWHKYQVNKLGKPVDREEWSMTPQTYNAYYNPANNEIVLPAGIFTVPGMQDDQLDDALVYGYAGASTIGHEITHGFDDQGRQYDDKGNLKDWWTPADAANFNKRAAVMIKQFDSYMPIDSMHINGEATLGENIADLGGVLLGWDAFKLTDAYKSGKKIGGFTPGQRFFMGYALGWLYQIRPETLARQLLTDVHAPAKYRVNGPFSDVDAFYEAFNVKPGDKMYIAPEKRVHIW